MARPPHADPAATRARVLDAAIRAFAASGMEGISMAELAAAAGVTAGTLHHYYGDKARLYEAAVDEVYRRLNARGEQLLAAGLGRDAEGVIDDLYRIGREERDGVRLLVRQVVDGGKLTPHTEAAHFLPALDALTRLAARRGRPALEVRAGVVALGYLLSRYVIQDDASLTRALGVRSAKMAHTRVVETLARTARALLGPLSEGP